MVAGLIIWLVTPLLAVTVLTLTAVSTGKTSAAPIQISPKPVVGNISRPVGLALNWGSAVSLYAPSWNGIVQKLYIQTGSAIASGQAVVRVNGIDRIAAKTSIPLDRPLKLGDRGEDVSALAKFLKEQSTDIADTDLFDNNMLIAVRKLAEQIGVTNAKNITSFEPSWLIFIPQSGIVAKIEFTVGVPAPSLGTKIIEYRPQLTAAVLVEEDSETSSNRSNSSNSMSIIAEKEENLFVGNEVITLASSRDTVSPEALQPLSLLLDPDSVYVPVNLRRSGGKGQWELPAPAVIANSTSSCVHVIRNNKQISLNVKPLATFSGKTIIEASLLERDTVTLYPVGEPVKCG